MSVYFDDTTWAHSKLPEKASCPQMVEPLRPHCPVPGHRYQTSLDSPDLLYNPALFPYRLVESDNCL